MKTSFEQIKCHPAFIAAKFTIRIDAATVHLKPLLVKKM